VPHAHHPTTHKHHTDPGRGPAWYSHHSQPKQGHSERLPGPHTARHAPHAGCVCVGHSKFRITLPSPASTFTQVTSPGEYLSPAGTRSTPQNHSNPHHSPGKLVPKPSLGIHALKSLGLAILKTRRDTPSHSRPSGLGFPPISPISTRMSPVHTPFRGNAVKTESKSRVYTWNDASKHPARAAPMGNHADSGLATAVLHAHPSNLVHYVRTVCGKMPLPAAMSTAPRITSNAWETREMCEVECMAGQARWVPWVGGWSTRSNRGLRSDLADCVRLGWECLGDAQFPAGTRGMWL